MASEPRSLFRLGRGWFAQPWFSLLLAVLILLFQLLYFLEADILMDDAFISFRYAENLADGLGLVFNPGERVEGYTNFLWVVILAAFRYLGCEIPLMSQILAGFATLGTLVVICQLGQRLFADRPARALWVAFPLLSFAALGAQARYLVSGMETSLFVFLLSLAVLIFLMRGASWQAGLFFALAALTRPEGVMYFGLTWGYAALVAIAGRRKPDGWRGLVWFAVGFGLLYGVYFIWRYAYFGYLLPNTYYAKAAGFQWSRLARGWAVLKELLSWWPIYAYLVLAVLALFSWKRNSIWVLLLGLNLATYAYFIFVGGDFIIWFGPRFLLPVLPFLLLAAAEGLARLVYHQWVPRHWVTWVGALSVLLLLFVSYDYTWPRVKFGRFNFATQMSAWKEMGLWIAAHTPEDAVIATDAAGLIPYYSRRVTIDMYGLTDAHIAHHVVDSFGQGTVAHERQDPEYVLAKAPDCIVSTWLNPEGKPLVAGLPRVAEAFESRYQLVLVAKARNGPPENGDWLIETSQLTQEIFEQGYVAGLFCRK